MRQGGASWLDDGVAAAVCFRNSEGAGAAQDSGALVACAATGPFDLAAHRPADEDCQL